MCWNQRCFTHTCSVSAERPTRRRYETSDTPGASVSISITGSVLLFHFHSISDATASHTECCHYSILVRSLLLLLLCVLCVCVCLPAVQVIWLTQAPQSRRHILPCFTLLFGVVTRAGGLTVQAGLLLPSLHMALLFIYIPEIAFSCFASMAGGKLFVRLKLPPASLI